MQIDKKSHVPLYRQVEQVLLDKITSGYWEVESKLPTEQELAKLFEVSTITVKQAIIELVNQGYLYRQRGKGTFVLGENKEQNINTFISLTTDTSEAHPHKLINFEIGEADLDIAKKLKLKLDRKVIRIERLKIVNGEPYAFECTYLPYEKFSILNPNDLNNELIYNVLKNKYNVSLGRAKLFIKPYILNSRKSKLLKVEPGIPVFKWERFTYTKQEELIEYSKFYIRQDKETYYTEVTF